MSDELYAYGTHCTWHGPFTFTEGAVGEGQTMHACCPKCGLPVEITSREKYWAKIDSSNNVTRHEDLVAMARWSQGRCFPDFDTLQNAYRQAMEGQ